MTYNVGTIEWEQISSANLLFLLYFIVRKWLESQIISFDFIEFCVICQKQTQKVAQLLHFITMSTKEKIPILGSKAVIFQNKYDVWQFRMYVKQARRYVEKSLRTKEQALAEERAEDLYIEIRNDIKNGKSFFAISIKDGVQM